MQTISSHALCDKKPLEDESVNSKHIEMVRDNDIEERMHHTYYQLTDFSDLLADGTSANEASMKLL